MKGYGTLHEIALYIGRPVKTVRNWAADDLIPTLTVGKVRLYHAASARRLSEQRPKRKRGLKREA